MEIERKHYLSQLASRKHNRLIKIVTGIRRCGKSYLVFNLFKRQLLSDGVKSSHIIEIALDDRSNLSLRNPDTCLSFVKGQIKDSGMYYLLMDEVQYMPEFEDVLNSFLHIGNLDVYVTGSNSKFLSSDIITEFRGRGDEVRVWPLSYAEFCSAYPQMAWDDAWNQYVTYGGLPYAVLLDKEEDKIAYLQKLFDVVYMKDIMERHKIADELCVQNLLDIVSSSVGSLTNPRKLENTFKSAGIHLSASTIRRYLDYFCDSFLIERAERYDVKGKRYITTPQKYYFSDIGLRNARLNFRQQEENHLMENVIFNELKMRGYLVDVGTVCINERQSDSRYVRKQLEIDFIANKGSRRYYIQSAFALPDEEKSMQEERPLVNVPDSFKKIIVVKDNIMLRRDEAGITTMGLKQFLLNSDSLEL